MESYGGLTSGIVDAHTHVFPAVMRLERSRYCDSDHWFDHLHRNEKAKLASAEDLIDSMNGAGIGGAVMCGFPWRDPSRCIEHNEYMAEAAEGSPDRLAWLATVSPTTMTGAAMVETLTQAFTKGAVGVGELNADAQGFLLETPEVLDTLAEICQRYDAPVMFHVSEPVGHIYPGKGTAWPQKFLRVLERFPALRVIAAHWGGGMPFYELMPEVRNITSHTVYDSAASTYLYDFSVFRTVLDIVGQERVLFASDYPVLGQRRFLKRVEAVSWRNQTERSAVLGDNARRVFQNFQKRVPS